MFEGIVERVGVAVKAMLAEQILD